MQISAFPDFIVCLEDGQKLKMLQRHLMTSYNLTPEAYRAKWALPRDFPTVATNYAATRSTLAKQLGLGRKPAETAAGPAVPAARKDSAPDRLTGNRRGCRGELIPICTSPDEGNACQYPAGSACPCPDRAVNDGRLCGGRSAWVRRQGASPRCFMGEGDIACQPAVTITVHHTRGRIHWHALLR